jgi:radical SAM superfamily enzyme
MVEHATGSSRKRTAKIDAAIKEKRKKGKLSKYIAYFTSLTSFYDFQALKANKYILLSILYISSTSGITTRTP